MTPSSAAAERAIAGTSVTIQLPTIQPKGVPIDWASSPNLLSAATLSASGTIGRKTFGPIALSAAQHGCQSTVAGLACSVTFSAAAGRNVPLHVSTYAGSNTRTSLATGTTYFNVFANQNNVIKPTMYGIAQNFGIRAQTDTLTQGFAARDQLRVYGIDAAKRPIPSSAIVNPSGVFVGRRLSIEYAGVVDQAPRQHPCCGNIATFTYNGLNAGAETLTVRVKGYPAASTTLDVVSGSTTPATLLTTGALPKSPPADGPLPVIAEFALNASGNVAPARTFIPPVGGSYPAFGEDLQGDFWVAGTHLTNLGTVLGTITLPEFNWNVAADSKGNFYVFSSSATCTIVEYPAGHYGHPKPVREIDLGTCNFPNAGIAVDAKGDVFLSVATSTPQVLEYPPSGSGSLAPIRVIGLSQAPYEGAAIDTDVAGNLYALIYPNLYEFAPGATTGKQLLAGYRISGFAVDDAGDIYADVEASASGPLSLEYFPAGSSSPTQIIEGSKAMLDENGGSIAVPRS